MDKIFGRKNFRNEIIWAYKTGITSAKSIYPRKHDNIFFYTKSSEYTFSAPREEEISESMHKRWGKYFEKDGKTILWVVLSMNQGKYGSTLTN